MRFSGLLSLAILLSACVGSQPDLAWMYQSTGQTEAPPPVIIVPGILGSRLTDTRTGEEVWPGSLLKLATSNYRSLALPIDHETLAPGPSSLRASGVFDSAAGRDFYAAIVRSLEQAAGYQPGKPGIAVLDGRPRYYILAYDWRQDNVTSARALDSLIAQIRRDYGKSDLKVDIIAHSMGGLIARYYLRYGIQDVLDSNAFPVNNQGTLAIRRLVLLGTPNLGSVSSMVSLLEGHSVGLRRLPPEVLHSMPSVYQLLPHALHGWLITIDGTPLERDQFDAYIWQRLEIGPWAPSFDPQLIPQKGNTEGADPDVVRQYVEKQLERARRFTWSLTVPAESEDLVELRVFGGNCIQTPSRLLVEEVNTESQIRLHPEEIDSPLPGVNYSMLMMEPGDGAVTKSSLLGRDALNPGNQRHPYIHFSARQAFFLCEKHEHLTGNVNFQDNLLHFFLSVD